MEEPPPEHTSPRFEDNPAPPFPLQHSSEAYRHIANLQQYRTDVWQPWRPSLMRRLIDRLRHKQSPD